MKLELLFSYHAILTNSLEVGTGPYGTRLIVEVDGGEFEGPKLKGRLRNAAAADWRSKYEKMKLKYENCLKFTELKLMYWLLN